MNKGPPAARVCRAQRWLLALTSLTTFVGTISAVNKGGGGGSDGRWLASQRGTFAQTPQLNTYFIQQQRGGQMGDLRCAKLLSDVRLTEGTVSSKLPPDITGLWLSQRCETRPGPEFLLRKYHFSSNRSFELLQFYYSDHLCSVATHAVHAEGIVQMTAPSWTVPGGMETDYILTKVSFLAYTNQAAANFRDKFNHSCSFPPTIDSGHTHQWSAKRWYTVYKYNSGDTVLGENSIQVNNDIEVPTNDDFDCLDILGVVFHELQLMRTEHRKSRHHRQRWKGRKTELLLGDVVYDPLTRHFYRPTSYQPPLLKNDQVNICAICRLVNKGSDLFPPHLDSQLAYNWPPSSSSSHQYLTGEWVSTRCETRPFSMFLTRQVTFYDDHHALRWKGLYHYFLDSRCRKPTFSISVRGRYHIRGASTVVDGATDVDFEVDHLMVTPHTASMVSSLNDEEEGRCGSSWSLSQTQDVTSSGGCSSLGLTVPAKEYEIVKVELDRYGNSWLYLGGQNTLNFRADDSWANKSEAETATMLRPSSFQLPLLQCRQRASLEEDLRSDNSLNPIPEAVIISSHLKAAENRGNCLPFYNASIAQVIILIVIHYLWDCN